MVTLLLLLQLSSKANIYLYFIESPPHALQIVSAISKLRRGIQVTSTRLWTLCQRGLTSYHESGEPCNLPMFILWTLNCCASPLDYFSWMLEIQIFVSTVTHFAVLFDVACWYLPMPCCQSLCLFSPASRIRMFLSESETSLTWFACESGFELAYWLCWKEISKYFVPSEP